MLQDSEIGRCDKKLSPLGNDFVVSVLYKFMHVTIWHSRNGGQF